MSLRELMEPQETALRRVWQMLTGANTPDSRSSNTTTEATPARGILERQSSKDEGTCHICFMEEPETNGFYRLSSCDHTFCINCLENFLRIRIQQGIPNPECPECPAYIHPHNIGFLLRADPDLITKYERLMLRRYLLSERHARWCPAPNCNFAVIADRSCPEIKCQRPECGVSFCFHCRELWHPNLSCELARKARHVKPVSSPDDIFETPPAGDEPTSGESGDRSERDSQLMKLCPRCKMLVVKVDDGACNHMVCTACGTGFCWLCLREIGELHYFSPSGCTFWGKRPWSSFRRHCFQLITFFTAPLAVLLIGAAALVLISLFLPVWAHRSMGKRYLNSPVWLRRVAEWTGFLTVMSFSPFVSIAMVTLGIPLLLIYIYVVLAISVINEFFDDPPFEEDAETVSTQLDAVSNDSGVEVAVARKTNLQRADSIADVEALDISETESPNTAAALPVAEDATSPLEDVTVLDI